MCKLLKQCLAVEKLHHCFTCLMTHSTVTGLSCIEHTFYWMDMVSIPPNSPSQSLWFVLPAKIRFKIQSGLLQLSPCRAAQFWLLPRPFLLCPVFPTYVPLKVCQLTMRVFSAEGLPCGLTLRSLLGICQHLPDWLLLALHFKFFLLFELTEPQISSKEKNSVKHSTYIRLKNQVNDFPD